MTRRETPAHSAGPEGIQADIEQTREDLAETVDALAAKVDVKQRAANLGRSGPVDGDRPQRSPDTCGRGDDRGRGPGGTRSRGRGGSAQTVSPTSAARPESPTDLTRASWGHVARRTTREFLQDQCSDLAAALTYYAVLAVFPASIALLSLVGLVGQAPRTVDTLLQIVRDVGGTSVASTLEPTLRELSVTPAAGTALIIGLATALWSASGYVSSFGRAMNRIYGIAEGRPVWKLRPFMLLVTLVTVVLAALVLVGLLVSGPAAQAIGDAVGVGSTAVTVWNIAKWPVILVVVMFIVALLYHATPNVKQPGFRWISPGAVVAVLVWLLASAGLAAYVANFSSYNRTYGSLAGAIVFLLWLWLTNLALMVGAELDAELERGRELQSGLRAEKNLQLPMRDTRKIEKDAVKDAEHVTRGRRLRHSRGDTADS